MKKRKQTFRLKLLSFSLMRGLLLFRGAGVCFLLLIGARGFAQNVGINATGATPNVKAMLDINANAATKTGLLVPRMTTTERSTITAPIPMSLLIFNTTTECFEAWNQTTLTWVAFGCIGCTAPTGVAALAGANPICVGSTLTLTGSATGATSWVWTGPNGFTSTLQSPTIAGITTAGAGVYTLTASNTCAAAPVNTASVTVNPVPSVAAAGADQTLACSLTAATLAGNVPVTGTGLWSVVSGTATITTPTSATSGITGLVAGSAVTLRWTISNAPCTPSTDDVVITTCIIPAFPCGGTVIPIVDVFNPSTGEIWMDRNLGASQVATSITDAAAYGDLYQWGRCSDGHEKRTSGTTSTLSATDTPGHGNFIMAPTTPFDWRSTPNHNLWQGANGTNNPCPAGYRLPTESELDAERLSWTSNDEAGAFASPLKLVVAGRQAHTNASLDNVASLAYYWSSTVSGTNARFLNFNSSAALITSYYRADGYSVRCIKD